MKPILFNTEMVRALLAGSKTVTRRVVKPQPVLDGKFWIWDDKTMWNDGICTLVPMPCHHLYNAAPYRPGDILYVRETWGCYERYWHEAGCFMYRADFPDGATSYDAGGFTCDLPQWRPSIHMPREAARIFLRVKDVRAERLQDGFSKYISSIFDFQAEGVDIGDQCRECIERYGCPCCVDPVDGECGILDDVRGKFSDIWDSTIKPADRDKYGWAANPWVWVIEFERISKEEAARCPNGAS